MAFDFLSGQATSPMQAYAPAWNTGQPQGMDYSQVLGGGQAMPATQGLDYMKIGQWAQNTAQQPDWQQLIGQMGPTTATMGTQATQSPLQNHARQAQLGQVQQGNAGYIGGNQRLGLLGMIR